MKTVIFIFALSAFSTGSNGSNSERMLNGVEVPIEEVPFQGSVEVFSGHKCSATIISSKYALLTAACATFSDVPEIANLRFGTATRLYDGKAYRCSGITLHPNFDKYNNTFDQKDYDIAIAEIFPELTMDNVTIKPIALPAASPAVGVAGRVSGWGSISEDGPIMVYVRATNVSVSSLDSCRTAFQDVFPVTDRMLCAGNPNGVTCNADIGSILVANNTVVGLSSWGYGCGKPGKPDVYVNIGSPVIRSFIRDVTGL